LIAYSGHALFTRSNRKQESCAATPGLVVVTCALLLAVAGCSHSTGARRGARSSGPAVAVHTTAVQHMTVQRQVDLAGTLLSPDQAKVSAEAAGVVRQVLVEIGQEVGAGDPLVKLEPRELSLALARAESALKQTRAQLGMHGPVDGNEDPPPDEEIASVKNAFATLEDARANAERAKRLASRGLMSPSDLQTSETRLKVTEAAYEAAVDSVRGQKALLQDRRASYDLAVKKLNDTVVRAPISGAVAERPVQVGEFISERTPVVTLVQTNPLKLRTGVQERYAGIVQPGQPVEFHVESYGDTVFHGKVAYVSPSLDETMRTFNIEALVDNADHRLKPGFFAKGVILTHKDDVLAVPDTAISVLAGVASVFVINDNAVTQQTVTLGVQQGDMWEIVDGLKGNEVLAANRLNELATGVSVKTGSEPSGQAPSGGRRGGGRRGQGQSGQRGGRRGGGA
jgi:HlyD family secretion protein